MTPKKPTKEQATAYSYQGESSRLSSTTEGDLQRPHTGQAAVPTKQQRPTK